MHFALVWTLAPQEAKACSLGREPQEGKGKTNPEPRRGDGSLPWNHACRRPFGAQGVLDRLPGADAPGYMPLPLAGQAPRSAALPCTTPIQDTTQPEAKRQRRRHPDPRDPHRQPARSKKSSAPAFHAASQAVRRGLREAYAVRGLLPRSRRETSGWETATSAFPSEAFLQGCRSWEGSPRQQCS
jgi:hypothetical protein